LGRLIRAWLVVSVLCAVVSAGRTLADQSGPEPGHTQLLDACRRIAKSLSVPSEKLEALAETARAYAQIGEQDKAERTFQEGLKAAEEAAHNLERFVGLIERLAQNEHYEWAYSLTAHVPDAGEALPSRESLRRRIVSLAIENGETKRAGGILETWLAAVHAGTDSLRRGRLSKQIAELFAAVDEREKACQGFSKALDAIHKAPESPTRATLLLETLNSFIDTCGYAMAEEEVNRLKDPAARAEALIFGARKCLAEKDTAKAETLLSMADGVAIRIADPRQSARLLAELFGLWRKLGKMQEAELSLRNLLETAARAERPADTDAILLQAIALYSQAGRIEPAQELMLRIRDDEMRRNAYYDLCLGYVALQRYDEALAAVDFISSRTLKGTAYAALVAALCRRGLIGPALETAYGIKEPTFRDSALLAAAEALVEDGRILAAVGPIQTVSAPDKREDAIERLIAAILGQRDRSAADIDLARRLASSLSVFRSASSLLAVAEAYRAAGREQEASKAFLEAFSSSLKLKDPVSRARIMGRIADLGHRLGQEDEAERLGNELWRLLVSRPESFPVLGDEGLVELYSRLMRRFKIGYEVAPFALRLAGIHIRAGERERALQLLANVLTLATRASRMMVKVKLYAGAAVVAKRAEMAISEEILKGAEEEADNAEQGYQARQSWSAVVERQRSGEDIKLAHFYRIGCGACPDVDTLVRKMEEQMPRLEVRSYDLADANAVALNEVLSKKMGLPRQLYQRSPAVFSANRALVTAGQITPEELRNLAVSARGLPAPWDAAEAEMPAARKSLYERYRTFTLLGVAWFGLIDGVNPCAFAVIIFFITYLAHLGKTRPQIAAAGITYTGAVFVTYLAIGLGLYELLGIGQRWSTYFQQGIYAVAAVMALTFAVLSFRDGIRCLQGRMDKVTLKLPERLRRKIRLTITRKARLGLTVGVTLGLGFAVALFEFPCTGQVYGPVIIAIRRFGVHRRAVGLLLVYNLSFIAPLIAIFLFVFFGLTSEQLTAFFQRHMAKTKFALGILFLALLAILLASELNAGL